MQGLKKISTRERSSAELRFASSLAPFWVWPGRRQGSAMNAYGALDPGLATPLPSCALFSRKQPKKGVDNADVVIHGLDRGRSGCVGPVECLFNVSVHKCYGQILSNLTCTY